MIDLDLQIAQVTCEQGKNAPPAMRPMPRRGAFFGVVFMLRCLSLRHQGCFA
ncbi:hypothetical protein [Paracoccus tibetensis]|uniref:hypothetical protein n=1 Tax=Paracoccus tibetensis TaxID=336292 RepID=UPI001587A79D|nr:hypothetical protein [Paracoccus tibetensis]